MQSELFYQIALSLVPQIGPVQARLLVEKFGKASEIFLSKKTMLENTEGIGPIRAGEIKQFKDFHRVEKELEFISRYSIKPLFINSVDYPKKLLHCYDPPTLLYYKGEADLNTSKTVGIIGTRKNSDYGRQLTEMLVEGLATTEPLIVSGLAFGIDVIAHKACLKNQLKTVGVMAHGLDTLYPPQHSALAREMLQEGGGLLTEFPSGTPPDKHNFPNRNRIVAGLCDVIVVVESGEKGGSMVTATLASGYNREVMAFPGRTIDIRSTGCNQLIQQQRAQLITGPSDLLRYMNWEEKKSKPSVYQTSLFLQLSALEQQLLECIGRKASVEIDEIMAELPTGNSSLAGALLGLELKGLIRKMPGQRFKLP